jgi:hypothetical protein
MERITISVTLGDATYQGVPDNGVACRAHLVVNWNWRMSSQKMSNADNVYTPPSVISGNDIPAGVLNYLNGEDLLSKTQALRLTTVDADGWPKAARCSVQATSLPSRTGAYALPSLRVPAPPQTCYATDDSLSACRSMAVCAPCVCAPASAAKALTTCAPIYVQLKMTFPEVVAVNALYTHGLVVIVSTRCRYGGFAKSVGMRVLSTPHGLGYAKIVIVVDENVDPFDLNQVMWAISVKVNPAADVMILPNLSVNLLLTQRVSSRHRAQDDHRRDHADCPGAARPLRPGTG